MMREDEFKVIRTDFNHLEKFLNNFYKEFPHYYLYKILSEDSGHETLAVVILRLQACWIEGDTE